MVLPTSLWDKAFQSLSPDLQANLGAARTRRCDILDAVLKDAEDKRTQSLRKRWKYTKSNGDTIIVRDVLEKIVRWVEKFKETGDVIVQYDPGHAALPWAAVRFLLRIAVSEVQVFAALVDDLEYIARMMVRYRTFEKLYLRGSQSDIEKGLGDTLTCLYAEILIHLSIAIKFFEEKALTRLLKSPFRSVDEERAKVMHDRENEVDAFAKLADVETLRSLEDGFTRLSTQTFRDLSEETCKNIRDWLSVAPYHHHHQFVAQSRLANSGEWLLNQAKFKNWQTSSSPSLLLLHGLPGSGKSTLCSIIVDTLSAAATNVPSVAPFGYFYCANPESEQDRRSSDSVLRAILFQLALDTSHQTKLRDFICAEYERQILQSRAGSLDIPKLSTNDCVRLILELAEEDPMTIVIDGIDAIDDTDRPALIQALREIVSKADNVVNILVSSRSSSRVGAVPSAEFRIEITLERTQRDMEAFVDQLVENAVSNNTLLEGDVCLNTKSLLKQELLKGAGEMFIWARLQVERICRETVEHDVITVLQTELPEDINQLYQESIERIFNGGDSARDIATKIISWILFMREPLTPGALLAALMSGKEMTLSLAQAIAACSNFVVLDSKCNVLRFAHQSAQDFLRQHPAFAATKAHRVLMACCIEVCSLGPSTTIDGNLQIPNDDFYVYAAIYWPIHVQISLRFHDDVAEAKDLVRRVTSFIFDQEWDLTLSFESWVTNVRLITQLLPRNHVMKPALSAVPEAHSSFLFVLSMFGLNDVLMLALSELDDVDVNEQNDLGHTPLYLASAFGHAKVVGILVDSGAKVNVECGKYGSPLHVACFHGHLEVVGKLLALGAQVFCGSIFKNALQAAFRGGKEDVALHLVDYTRSIETEDDYDEALGQAALLGFISLVQKLHLSRFSSSKTGSQGRMQEKIRKAIQGGQVGVLRQFLSRDATNAHHLPSAAVALATLHNRKSMVEFLLDQGMDLEAQGDFGSPLRTAALLNFQSIVRLLLDKGAQIDAYGLLGDALQAAALNGHTSVVRLLIQEGANVNQYSGYYGSALQAAAYHGHIDTVELLIDSNADANAAGYSKSAIHAATEGGHEDVLMLMLHKYRCPMLYGPVECLTNSHGSPYKGLLENASPGLSQFRDQEAIRSDRGTHRHPRRNPITDMETVFRVREDERSSDQFCMEDEPTSKFAKDWWQDEDPLVTAASFGHGWAVNWLLTYREASMYALNLQTITSAISAASKHGHSFVVQILLDFIVNWPATSQHKEIEGMKCKPMCGEDAALRVASENCSPEECVALSEKYSTKARKYHQFDVDKVDVLLDFSLACKTGNVQLAASILDTEHHRLLPFRAIEEGIQLCGLYGQPKVAQLLLESPNIRDRQSSSGMEAFVNAAAGGFLETMTIFVSHWKESLRNKETLGRALVVASKGGHIAAVRYLVLELGADINSSLPDKCYVPTLAAPENHMDNFNADHIEAAVLPVISPLQASLQGLALSLDTGIHQHHNYIQRTTGPRLRKASLSQQEQVIEFLLRHDARPNDAGGQQMIPIQVASRCLSPKIVQLLISAGADVNASGCVAHGSKSRNGRYPRVSELYCPGLYSSAIALFEAVGRESSGLPIVQLLTASGASLPEDVNDMNYLLDQALRFVDGDTSSTNSSTSQCSDDFTDGGFEHASSLEQVFSDGPGAVLFFLLSRMPQVKATDWRWTLVLQMAAFLNHGSFVDLLLSRGTDVNGAGYCYGTALQAAARCGHAALVQKLLDAGAEVNVTGGVWHSALRASLVNGLETTIFFLLDHGADITLEPNQCWDSRLSFTFTSNESSNVLQLAVQTGNTNIVKAILAKGFDAALEPRDPSQHPLIIAARKGSLDIVRALLDSGAPVNAYEGQGFYMNGVVVPNESPVHVASAGGHLDVLNHLICSGADVNGSVEGSSTPVATAASWGHIQVVRRLISAGARTNDGAALENAVRYNHLEIVKVLLDSREMAKGVITLACRSRSLDVVEWLVENALENDAPVAVFNEAYSTDGLSDSVTRLLLKYATPTAHQFIQACATASLSSVESLLQEAKFDVNHADEDSGDYPLQIAALNLRPDVVRLLVSCGATIDVESSNHGTPLNTALKVLATCQLSAIQFESMRCTVNDPSISEPMEWAIPFSTLREEENCESIVKHLVAHGANTERVEPFLGPPLHIACLIGSSPLVEMFLKTGNTEHILDSSVAHFMEPLFAAIQGKHSNITSLLLQRKPSLDHIHAEYGTALHHACTNGDASSAALLLEHGADATIRNLRGQTSLTVALQQELQERNSISGPSSLALKSRIKQADRKLLRREWTQRAMGRPTPLKAILDLAKPIHISDEDLTIAAEMGRCHRNKRYVLSRLLSMDSSRLTQDHRPAIDTLEMVLERDPSTRVTPNIFLNIFQDGSSTALRLLHLLEKHGKRVYITTRIREALEDAYKLGSQVAIKGRFKGRFYGLLTEDESDWDSAGSDA